MTADESATTKAETGAPVENGGAEAVATAQLDAESATDTQGKGEDQPVDGKGGDTTAASAGNRPQESVKKADFQPLADTSSGGMKTELDLLYDVGLPVSVELGRTSMTIKDLLSVSQGSVITLERAAGEAVDVLVSGKIIGRGEVVVVDDRFGIRITELIGRMDGMVKS
jgi:flagellar motor switch protein FliN/FliY